MSPHRRYPPAYLRYLRARLWNFSRPAFWGTAIFLSVLGLGIREYWANPDFLTFLQNNKQAATPKPPDSSLSDEDRAIAADIDNLPVLINDAQQSNLLVAPSTRKEKSQDNKSKNLLDDLISKQEEAAKNAKSNPVGIVGNVPASKQTNPFVAQAESLLQAGTANTGSQLFGVKSSDTSSYQPGIPGSSSNLGIGLPNQINNNQNPAPISALQTAINSSTQKPSSLNNTTSNFANTIGRSLPSNDLSNQGFSANTQLNTNPNDPISTTGSQKPTVTNQPQNYYTNFPDTQSVTSYQNPIVTNQPQNYYTNSGSELGTTYQKPIVTNQPQNYYGNLNVQPLPSVVTPTSTGSPVTYTAPNNIAPYSPQAPNQGAVQWSNQVGYGNGNLNPSLPQTQSPQSNLTVPPLSAGQYGGVNINGYTYP
ncbi:hypothetical protein OGM63_10600 [Plectonema radiosum NIES-515]|uniref:Uncharacterized protein n=1 Tax=Plectonema radiosum NIES-515 TaxID=2986073 RepID=A0ABT3AXV0_9CYAN|nr:hypothetical protein [Plectonema radiosum]MCV3213958.1 hypothetical protein [Plectonema radiosum NIES-515]